MGDMWKGLRSFVFYNLLSVTNLLFGEWNNENFIPTFIYKSLIGSRLFVNYLLKLYLQKVRFYFQGMVIILNVKIN